MNIDINKLKGSINESKSTMMKKIDEFEFWLQNHTKPCLFINHNIMMGSRNVISGRNGNTLIVFF